MPHKQHAIAEAPTRPLGRLHPWKEPTAPPPLSAIPSPVAWNSSLFVPTRRPLLALWRTPRRIKTGRRYAAGSPVGGCLPPTPPEDI